MPTDDERREVARRLCEYPDPHFPTEQTMANAYRAVVECIYPDGEEPRSIRQILDRLADLVDPATAECSCDRDALLRLADEIEAVYCPDGSDFDQYVRRIRKALEVPE